MSAIRCRPDHAALAVIDVQDKLLKAMPRPGELVRDVGFLMDVAKLLDVPIIATEQYPQGLGPTSHELAVKFPKPASAKTLFSCSGAPDFLPSLRRTGRRQIVVAGMEAHVCVLQTVLDLIDDGFTVFLPEDAIQSRADRDCGAAIRRMERAGAIPATVEMLAFEWMGDAKHPRFKEVSQLVRARK